MSKIKRLIQSYGKYIAVPWRDDAAALQRVIFCVYNETEERWLRAKFDEFEIVTRQAGHDWAIFDLTDTFAIWLASQRYAKSYYQKPHHELDTFVCDGEYQKGMAHILETYLKNIDQAQQPAVWVSGFYGSGKSHLVKMLRALWVDVVFEDGATARGIANLPQNISDQMKELSTQAKRHGGLYAASGTLGAGASGSVRLALLRIIFKSADLPEQYPVARFVMWLKAEGIFEQVQSLVKQQGLDWDEELDNFYVAEGLHEALVQTKPQLFSSPTSCVETLNNLYPYVHDISSDDMLKAMRQALTSVTTGGKFPLTLIVLDEVQQYIGEDSQRSIDVQEVVEACCKNIGGKLLFIGTGQTAVTGTSNLKKLEGRFTIRVELPDADVDAVIRQVILAKKPEAKTPIEQMMQTNLGEISRHLAGTTIGHRQDDISHFTQDYPMYFWSINWQPAIMKSVFVPPSTPWPISWSRISPVAPAPCAASSLACSTGVSC